MFDIGWLELLLIGIVALIVVGPKDLPGMFRTVGRYVGQLRRMAREFQRSMEDAADVKDIRENVRAATEPLNELNKMRGMNLNSATNSARKYAAEFAERKAKAAMGEETATAATTPTEPAPAPKPAPAAAATTEAPADPASKG